MKAELHALVYCLAGMPSCSVPPDWTLSDTVNGRCLLGILCHSRHYDISIKVAGPGCTRCRPDS